MFIEPRAITALAAADRVAGSVPRVEAIGALVACDEVMTPTAVKTILAAPAAEAVVSASAVYAILAPPREDAVGPAECGNHVGALRSADDVRTSCA